MFRSIVSTRNEFIKSVIKRQVRNRISRGLSSQCVRKGPRQWIDTSKNRPLPLIWNQYIVRSFADYPSYIAVRLPALSPTMETGTIISWAKKEGDKLNEGDLLAEIETDKATMGFETPEEGYLAKILVPAGTKDVPIGKIVCVITENQSDVSAFKDYKDEGAAAAPSKPTPPPPAPSPPPPTPAAAPPPSAPMPAAPTPSPTSTVQGDRPYASPMARRLAEMHNIRLQGKGSGIFGSIKSTDLSKLEKAPKEAMAETPVTPVIQTGASYIDIPVSNIRGVIAKRLLQSKTTIPHYYLTREINIEKLQDFRSSINKELEKQKIKLSFNDFIIKTVAAASTRVPEVNASWMDTHIRQYNNVDVSVAVATDRGLITPIVFNADRKGVIAISQDMKVLATKAKENKLQPNEFQGGTISVSNLGMFDITHFCAIINPPQAAILACGGIIKRVVPAKDGQFKEAPHMIVTLSCDHRVVDGAVGAQWLKVFADGLSDPARMCL